MVDYSKYKKTTKDEIIEIIRDSIVKKKEYKHGEKLPSESTLAEMFNVSRGTIRESLLVLSTQNLVNIQRGRGTFVIYNENNKNIFVFDEKKHDHIQMAELYELRLIFEPNIAAYAAKRATDEELKRILDIGKDLQGKLIKGQECITENRKFHSAIASASHNAFAGDIVKMLNQAIDQLFNQSEMKQFITEGIRMDHLMIMEYLKLRNAEGVRLAMELHISNTMRDYGLDV